MSLIIHSYFIQLIFYGFKHGNGIFKAGGCGYRKIINQTKIHVLFFIDEQNPGDHVTGPSGENATNNGDEPLEECSSTKINLEHKQCAAIANASFNGDDCGGPNVIFGVEGTIDLGFAEFDVNLSIDNNQDCGDDDMALNAEISQCDVDKAAKEDECANGGG